MSFKQFETYKAQRIYVAPVSNSSLFALPPASAVLNPGFTERVQSSVNRDGNIVPVDQFVTEEDAQLVLTWSAGQFQLEILQFIFGRLFAPASAQSVQYIDDALVLPSLRVPPVGTSFLGGGVASDTGIAFTKDEFGLSQSLTRSTFTAGGFGTGSTSTLGFMVGTGLELFFTPDLEGRTVAYQVSETVDVARLTDADPGFFRIQGLLINTSREISIFKSVLAKPILEGSSFDPGADSVSVTFRLFTPAGACKAYEIDVTTLTIAC
jgi:hypothetical protein